MISSVHLLAGIAVLFAVALGCGRGTTAGEPSSMPASMTATSEAPTALVVGTSAAPAPRPTAAPTARPAGTINRIAFSSLDGAIYTVAPDGTDLRLTAAPVADEGARTGFRGAFMWPVWSPDGKRIMFSSLVPGARGLTVSLRIVDGDGGEPETIYQDDPGTTGIGSGVAHYAYWSPDSRQVALIAGTSRGLTGKIIDVATAKRKATVADGAPMYFAWGPNSKKFLVHHQNYLRLYEFDDDGQATGGPRQIGGSSLAYFAPSFSPNGEGVLYADSTSEGAGVLLRRLDDTSTSVLMRAEGRVAFHWAPDGRRVAILSVPQDGLFGRLSVLSAGGSHLFDINRPNLISFWWSPDSTRLAVIGIVPEDDGTNTLEVFIVDARDASQLSIGTVRPTEEYLFMQLYFDQYAHSLQPWSPDSRRLVVFGALGPRSARVASTRNQVAELGHAWVLDASNVQEPVLVGKGYVGSWSPR